MYNNIKLINGDLSFNNLGQLEIVSNVDAILQNIYKRLNTIRETLFYDYDYGIDKEIFRIKRSPSSLMQLQSIIDNTLSYDKNVSSSIITDIKDNTIMLQIYLNDGTLLDINYNIDR